MGTWKSRIFSPCSIAHDVADLAIVHALRAIFRIPDHFVDEIAEMQHEAETILFGGALVFVDHPAIGVLRALIRVLAADEREA